jgi:PKD repeat protein
VLAAVGAGAAAGLVAGGTDRAAADAGSDGTPGYGGSSLPRTADGWTDLSAFDVDRRVYVSRSEGADDGTYAREAPLRTIAAGVERIRDGHADWLLLKRGDTWRRTDGAVLNGVAGRNAGRGPDARAVVAAYGDGPRPRIELDGATKLTNAFPGGTDPRPANVAVVGIEAYVYTRDPDHDAYRGPETSGQKLFRTVGDAPVANYLIEDCVFRFPGAVWAQAAARGGVLSRNLEFRRNVIESTWRPNSDTEWVKPMGLVMYRVDGFLCEENVFFECGKCDGVDRADPNFLSHALYLGTNDGTSVTNYTVRGNYVVDSGHGLKCQADGRVEDNYLERDCTTNLAAATRRVDPSPASILAYNVKVNGTYYVNDRSYRWHADRTQQTPVANGFSLGTPDDAATPHHTVANNIVSTWQADDGVFSGIAGADEDWVRTAGYNVVYDWGDDDPVPGQYATNNTDGGDVPDPDRDAAAYNAALGGPESYRAYMDTLLSRGPGNDSLGDLRESDWPVERTAYALNDFVRAGWGKPPSGNAPDVPGPSVVPGRPATDVDGDGRYEDVNGNGRTDFDDVVALFERRASDSDGDVDAFDFNGNWRVDFEDVVALFEQL